MEDTLYCCAGGGGCRVSPTREYRGTLRLQGYNHFEGKNQDITVNLCPACEERLKDGGMTLHVLVDNIRVRSR